ncbi:MAG: ATP-binding cassette domain-containing protein [Rhodospirillaceae bacterium]|nr:ATP-binding cassette domain-containing protein [Rhodospirillaceae bacterium]
MSAGLRFAELSKAFVTETRRVEALSGVSGEIAPGQITGLVGPDGAGKTTLVRLLAGLFDPDAGRITVTGDDARAPRIAYMPQKFGLYEDLTVGENLDLYADLNGLGRADRERRFAELHRFTELGPFTGRLAGKLSGGMKQKLGLACTLVVPPDVLLLDEPSVGVDPLSRRELWAMVRTLQSTGIAVLWSTAYLDEAERCDHVILLHDGAVLDSGTPAHLNRLVADRAWRAVIPRSSTVAAKRDLQRAAQAAAGVVDAQIQGRNLRVVMDGPGRPPDFSAAAFAPLRSLRPEPTSPQFEDTYLAALRARRGAPAASRSAGVAIVSHHQVPQDAGAAIETRDLTRRFGPFTAVDRVSFRVDRGEIFGLLGPNGAGKSTTFKMLCGLLPPSAGTALVAGYDLGRARADARAHIGYMAQKFAYNGLLSMRQNMTFAGGVYGLSGKALAARIADAADEFQLRDYLDEPCGQLPLGIKQRMALACALLHRPSILFLDEPTSGVDPETRREFWTRLNALADDGTTILITSHFLDEAEYCDRMVIIYRGRLIAAGSPDEIKAAGGGEQTTLNEAFIALVERHDREAA